MCWFRAWHRTEQFRLRFRESSRVLRQQDCDTRQQSMQGTTAGESPDFDAARAQCPKSRPSLFGIELLTAQTVAERVDYWL